MNIPDHAGELADRRPDGGGHRRFCGGGASQSVRLADTGPAGLADPVEHQAGAGTDDLHVRVDGPVWRAYGVRTCIHVGVGVLIMTPIPLPVAMTLGIDPLHFGIMMVVSMAVGMCHRPVGLNLYVASGIAKMGISELAVAVMSWLLTMLSFLVVTCAPQISPRLPNRLYGSCVALARWIDQ